MKTYIFSVCLPSGSVQFADIKAASSTEAVRLLVSRFPGCRANIVNVVTA